MEEVPGLTVACPVCLEDIAVTMSGEDEVTITLHDGMPDAAEVELTVRIEHTCRAKATMRVHAGPNGPVRAMSVMVPGRSVQSPGS